MKKNFYTDKIFPRRFSEKSRPETCKVARRRARRSSAATYPLRISVSFPKIDISPSWWSSLVDGRSSPTSTPSLLRSVAKCCRRRRSSDVHHHPPERSRAPRRRCPSPGRALSLFDVRYARFLRTSLETTSTTRSSDFFYSKTVPGTW